MSNFRNEAQSAFRSTNILLCFQVFHQFQKYCRLRINYHTSLNFLYIFQHRICQVSLSTCNYFAFRFIFLDKWFKGVSHIRKHSSHHFSTVTAFCVVYRGVTSSSSCPHHNSALHTPYAPLIPSSSSPHISRFLVRLPTPRITVPPEQIGVTSCSFLQFRFAGIFIQ